MNSYQELKVWQKSIGLVLLIYKISNDFPEAEKFGLTNQMRRASVSVPSNIAEGYARKGNNEFIRFLRISYGSAVELETQLLIAHKLKFVSKEDFGTVSQLIVEILKMMNKLMTTLSNTKN